MVPIMIISTRPKPFEAGQQDINRAYSRIWILKKVSKIQLRLLRRIWLEIDTLDFVCRTAELVFMLQAANQIQEKTFALYFVPRGRATFVG